MTPSRSMAAAAQGVSGPGALEWVTKSSQASRHSQACTSLKPTELTPVLAHVVCE